MTDLTTELDAFHTWLKQDKNLTGGTPDMYTSYVSRLNTPLDLDELTVEETQSILQDAVTTVPVRSAFKKYLAYLKAEHDLSIQQQRDIAFLRDELDNMEDLARGTSLNKSEVLRKYLTAEEVQQVVEYVETKLDAGAFGGRRYYYDQFRVLPVLLLETGCRISELIGKQNDPENTGLRVADIDFDDNQIRIRNAKGNKDRFADFHDAAPLLRTYLDQYDISTGKVFDIPYWRVNYVFKKIGKEVFGFPGPNDACEENEYRLTAHWFRHSFATNWVIKEYRDTDRWAEAKERVHNYLDHEQMDTTEAYIGAAKELERDNIFEEQGGFDIQISDNM